ncbi:chaperonin GroES [Actinopolymorpha cephalotaxi]|uniref:10 kDa chaperonin n=2 Tax=Actinopolymorphaceae TaxID=2805400 RepID=A0A1I2K8W4_9ACTN|nr:chaperonin GroES [Actinopolymorpha cephalotaxi]
MARRSRGDHGSGAVPRGVCGGGAVTSHDVTDSHAARLQAEKLPIRMLHDRVLVSMDSDSGERRSSAGIVIPATAQMGKRLAWARVVAIGPHVRTIVVGDRVLFDPEERAEIEVRAEAYVLLRERDIHAVASERLEDDSTGLYL